MNELSPATTPTERKWSTEEGDTTSTPDSGCGHHSLPLTRSGGHSSGESYGQHQQQHHRRRASINRAHPDRKYERLMRSRLVCERRGCGRTFNRIGLIAEHRLADHLGHRFYCPQSGCGSHFAHRGSVRSHLNSGRHHYQPYVCGLGPDRQCPYESANRTEFEHHVMTTHSTLEADPATGKYRCDYPQCRQSYRESYRLVEHRIGHYGHRYFCSTDDCCRHFAHYRSLQSHERSGKHVMGEPYRCSVALCQYSTDDKEQFRAHIETSHMIDGLSQLDAMFTTGADRQSTSFRTESGDYEYFEDCVVVDERPAPEGVARLRRHSKREATDSDVKFETNDGNASGTVGENDVNSGDDIIEDNDRKCYSLRTRAKPWDPLINGIDFDAIDGVNDDSNDDSQDSCVIIGDSRVTAEDSYRLKRDTKAATIDSGLKRETNNGHTSGTVVENGVNIEPIEDTETQEGNGEGVCYSLRPRAKAWDPRVYDDNDSDSNGDAVNGVNDGINEDSDEELAQEECHSIDNQLESESKRRPSTERRVAADDKHNVIAVDLDGEQTTDLSVDTIDDSNYQKMAQKSDNTGVVNLTDETLATEVMARREEAMETDGDNNNNKNRSERYSCDYMGCTKTFAHPGSVSVHMRSHTLQGLQMCGINGCQYRTVYKGNMKTHRAAHSRPGHEFRTTYRTHATPPNVKRPVGRPATANRVIDKREFTSSGGSGGHSVGANNTGHRPPKESKRPSNGDPFLCQWFGCGKSFANNEHLELHKQCHRRVTHRCFADGCSVVFSTAGHLRRHLTGHHLKYRCDRSDCGYATDSESQFAAHMADHLADDGPRLSPNGSASNVANGDGVIYANVVCERPVTAEPVHAITPRPRPVAPSPPLRARPLLPRPPPPLLKRRVGRPVRINWHECPEKGCPFRAKLTIHLNKHLKNRH